MSRYTADGRRRSSMTHASRAHTCPGCGKVVYGNGGKASHQRACPDFRITHLAHLEKMIEHYDGERSEVGSRMSFEYRVEREEYLREHPELSWDAKGDAGA